eukprot:TRINITY_DN999_c0_g3_i1.p2 TRINITY_DN999_c0_g3~~TRINITY_DN999_c0_g3_i1.p2  ORF type:complete len:198 (+),score=63.47 TRINITY_DN999_c0_g3_i1:1057-1650(+)
MMNLVAVLLSCVLLPEAAGRRQGTGSTKKARVAARLKDEGGDISGETMEDEVMIEEMEGVFRGEKFKELKCSTCKVVVSEVRDVLASLHKRLGRVPKGYEAADVLEDICTTMHNDYGILRKNNKLTTSLSKNAKISRIVGYRIGPFIESFCGDIMDEAEHVLTRHGTDELESLRTRVCIDELDMCTDAMMESRLEEL